MATLDTSRLRVRPSSQPPPKAGRDVPALRIDDGAFVSDATLDGWVRSGAASRAGALLGAADGRRYVLRDAIRVIGRRNGDTDPYGLTGRVESIRDYIRQGAAVSADALRLGPAVYDIEHGVVVARCDDAGPRQDA